MIADLRTRIPIQLPGFGISFRRWSSGISLATLLSTSLASEAAGQWTATITPTLNPLPIGLCGAVQIQVDDGTGGGRPRNPSGYLISLADFDMSVTSPDAGAVVGQQVDPSHWSVCACQAGVAGGVATITASYPAKRLSPGERVRGVAFQTTTSFTLGASRGLSNPSACAASSQMAAIAVAPPPASAPTAAVPSAPPVPATATPVGPQPVAVPAQPSSKGTPVPAAPAPPPPGPVPTLAQGDALHMRSTSIVSLSGAGVSIGSLTLPQGKYLVVAKALFSDPVQPRRLVSCQLGFLQSELDIAFAGALGELAHVGVFTGPATVDWRCNSSGAAQLPVTAGYRSIIAVRLGTVTTVP